MIYSAKLISHESELIIFAEGYSKSFKDRQKISKRDLNLDILKSSDCIWGIYKGNKMVAGFINNYKPARCIGEFSREKQEEILAQFKKDEICELVAIWKLSSEKNAITTIFMWATIIIKTLSLNKKYIFGCSRSNKVGKTFYYTNKMQYINNQETDLQVFYYTRKQFLMTFISSFKKFLKKKLSINHKNRMEKFK